MFTVGESPPNTSGKYKREQQTQQRWIQQVEILAGKDLQTKLLKSKNVDFKFSASNGTAKANTVN